MATRGRMPWLLAGLMWLLGVAAAPAAETHVTEDILLQLLPKGLQVGSKDPFLPVWPILKDGRPAGYVFESNQLVDIPGFTGTPIDLLVAMDDQGRFLDVRVVSQNEPVFAHGLGPRPLFEFVTQYRGRSIHDTIKIATPHSDEGKRDAGSHYIDGVTKATASVRIVNETLLASALKVARAKLTASGGGPTMRLKDVAPQPMSWQQLLDEGLVRPLRLSNRDVEAAFAGSRFTGLDEEGRAHPDDRFIDLYVASLDLPVVAQNLFTPASLKRIANLPGIDGLHLVAVMTAGRYAIAGPDYVAGTVPDRTLMRQGDFPVEYRDAAVELDPLPGLPPFGEILLFKTDRRLGFEPASPWSIDLRVTRQRGNFYPETGSRDFTLNYALSDRYVEAVPTPGSFPVAESGPAAEAGWVLSWRENAFVLAGLAVFLLALTAVLIWQEPATRRWPLFQGSRWVALAITLGFVGWYGQGQLSILQVLAVVKAAGSGASLSFFLYDPISTTLWAYALLTLPIWGRGVFCGWLCPFGALQEFVAVAAQALRIPQRRLSPGLELWLPRLRHAILAVLVGGTILAPSSAETLAEVEPFKTAITLAFQRDWPFVVYALAALALGLFVFKGYCRFLCPLGGALALMSRVRFLRWIPRRQECGTPCQLCANRCRYRAIAKDGRIDNPECFQCLECVAIYHDRATCVPLVLDDRRKQRIPS